MANERRAPHPHQLFNASYQLLRENGHPTLFAKLEKLSDEYFRQVNVILTRTTTVEGWSFAYLANIVRSLPAGVDVVDPVWRSDCAELAELAELMEAQRQRARSGRRSRNRVRRSALGCGSQWGSTPGGGVDIRTSTKRTTGTSTTKDW